MNNVASRTMNGWGSRQGINDVISAIRKEVVLKGLNQKFVSSLVNWFAMQTLIKNVSF